MHEAGDSWSDIPKADRPGSRNERRADPDHPLDFYRARDELGRYMLILKCEQLPELGRLPTMAGLNIAIQPQVDRPHELCVELRDTEQLSIFRALAADILHSTIDVVRGDALSGGRRLISRVERWQELLKRRRDQTLSREAIIGLAGELLFLRDRVLPRYHPNEALISWRGCFRDEQDFAIGPWIVEIKSQLSTADQYLKISSEAQLDTSSGPIVLCHQTIASSPSDEPDARTLNQLVAEIRKVILQSGPAAIDLFEAGLIAAGYETRSEYDEESWLPVQFRTFEITESFPRLIPSNIPAGVQAVSYRIPPGACADHQRDETWLNQMVFHDRSA